MQTNKILKRIVLLLVLIFPTTALAETWSLTLSDAIDRAMQENRDVSIARQRIAEFEGLKGEALSAGLPHLDATGEYDHIWKKPEMTIQGQTFQIGNKNQYIMGAQFSQLLWSAGKVSKAFRAAKSEEKYGEENLRDIQMKVTLNVKQTYYEILYTKNVIEVLEKQLKALKDHLASIKSRYAKGLESDYALMRQEVAVANLEPELLNAKKTEELLKNGLKVLVVIPQGDEFIPKDSFTYTAKKLKPVEELVNVATEKNPELAAQKNRKRSYELNVGIEKAGYLPTLNFTTGVEWQGLTDNWIPSASEKKWSLSSTVMLSIPIFDGLKTHSRVKQARAKLFQQSSMLSKLEDDIIKTVKDVNESIAKARLSLESQKKTLNTAKKASAIASERFSAGLISQLELLDTINSQAKSEELYLRALFDCLIGEAALEVAVGGEIE